MCVFGMNEYACVCAFYFVYPVYKHPHTHPSSIPLATATTAAEKGGRISIKLHLELQRPALPDAVVGDRTSQHHRENGAYQDDHLLCVCMCVYMCCVCVLVEIGVDGVD